MTQGDCRTRMRCFRSTCTLMNTASTPPVVESEASTRPAPLHVSRETPLRPRWVRPSPSRESRSTDRSRASDTVRSLSRDHSDDGRVRTLCSLRRSTPPPSTSRRFHVNPYLQPAPRVVEAVAVGTAEAHTHLIDGPTVAEASRIGLTWPGASVCRETHGSGARQQHDRVEPQPAGQMHGKPSKLLRGDSRETREGKRPTAHSAAQTAHSTCSLSARMTSPVSRDIHADLMQLKTSYGRPRRPKRNDTQTGAHCPGDPCGGECGVPYGGRPRSGN